MLAAVALRGDEQLVGPGLRYRAEEVPMSYKLSERSLNNLAECHPDLQKIAHELIKEMDVLIVDGHRGEKEQNDAFRRGTSKLRYPNSKHNKKPALAFDAVPFVKGAPGGIDWSARARFLAMREHFKLTAARLGIQLRFISWDLPHIELANSEIAKK